MTRNTVTGKSCRISKQIYMTLKQVRFRKYTVNEPTLDPTCWIWVHNTADTLSPKRQLPLGNWNLLCLVNYAARVCSVNVMFGDVHMRWQYTQITHIWKVSAPLVYPYYQALDRKIKIYSRAATGSARLHASDVRSKAFDDSRLSSHSIK